MSIRYHRRWYWKYIGVSYLCSFAAGWVLVHGRYWVALPLCLMGFLLAFAAGHHAHAVKEEMS